MKGDYRLPKHWTDVSRLFGAILFFLFLLPLFVACGGWKVKRGLRRRCKRASRVVRWSVHHIVDEECGLGDEAGGGFGNPRVAPWRLVPRESVGVAVVCSLQGLQEVLSHFPFRFGRRYEGK